MGVESAPGWGRDLWGEKVAKERIINRQGGVCPWEGWEAGSLAGGHILLGRPDVLRGGSGQELRPIRNFGALDRLEVAEFREPRQLDVLVCGVLFHGAHRLVYSLRRAASGGVHHGLDLSEGRERGVLLVTSAVRVSSEIENQ